MRENVFPNESGSEIRTRPSAAGSKRELRSRTRVSLDADVVIACGTQFFSGKAIDLSELGLFVATGRVLDVGSRVSLELSLPEGPVLARGHVRWQSPADSEREAGLGIEFDTLPDEDQRRVEKHCAARPRFLTYDEIRALSALADSA